MTTTSRLNSLAQSSMPRTTAATAILDVAERLAQSQGYNGFSYADIAAELQVTKASLHYHFASKALLGRALIERYDALFQAALAAIDDEAEGPQRKLERYAALYHSVLSNQRMCLCGMLAAEYATLPAPMQQGLTQFFDANERWLTKVLKDGLRSAAFTFREPANQRARLLLGALEGAMLVARSYGDARRFELAASCLLADLRVDREPAPRPVTRRSAARRSRFTFRKTPKS
jgi:TetR/AcrR family transcriptional regulator, transcriptional repressor for nem operon